MGNLYIIVAIDTLCKQLSNYNFSLSTNIMHTCTCTFLSINLQTNASYNVNSATTDGQPEDPLYSVIDDPTTTSQQTAHRAHTALVPVPYHQEIERDGTVGPADYEQPLNSLRTSPQKQHEKGEP